MEVKKQNPIAMTKLWIDNNMVIRWHPNGWPEKPEIGGIDDKESILQYEKALAQAKAESVPVEYANGEPVTNVGGKPDSFFEVNGEVEFLWQYYGHEWRDCVGDPVNYMDYTTRKVARLKPTKEPIRADLTEQQMDDHIEALTAPFPTEEKLIQMTRCCQDMHKENMELRAQLAAAEKRVKELETKLRLSETLSQGYRNQKSSLGADLAALNVKYEIAEYALRDIDMLYDVADPPYTPKKLADIARIALKKIGKYEDTETK